MQSVFLCRHASLRDSFPQRGGSLRDYKISSYGGDYNVGDQHKSVSLPQKLQNFQANSAPFPPKKTLRRLDLHHGRVVT